MPVAAVLGWPLEHTLSPTLHEAAYRAAGLTGWRYEARPTRPEELAAALGQVRAGALAGVNLTVPHKQAAVALLDQLEPPADALGAVNTVRMVDARLTGANTDVSGVLWALGNQLGLRGPGWDGQGPALLLGTGGAALAAAYAWARLAEARRRHGLATCALAVAGRSPGRAATVAAHAGAGATTVAWERAAEAVAAARVLVRNYGATAQGLVDAARAAGATAAVDGLGMLCAQAAGAVVKLAGIRPDLRAMADAVGLPWPAATAG